MDIPNRPSPQARSPATVQLDYSSVFLAPDPYPLLDVAVVSMLCFTIDRNVAHPFLGANHKGITNFSIGVSIGKVKGGECRSESKSTRTI